MDPKIAEALGLVDDFKTKLEALNATPHSIPATEGPGSGGDGGRKLLSGDDIFEMQQQLRKLSTPHVYHAFSKQLRVKSTGVPLDIWLAGGGQQLIDAVERDPLLSKALDTTSGSALVRQDLEPFIYELFVRQFPAYDRITKEPANGLVHTYTQQTSPGGAEHISELGTVIDDKGTYVRKTTNIAIVGTRRGVTLKQQFAALQSGSGFNPEQLEMRSALTAIAAKVQKDIFQGNDTDTESGGTESSEAGEYDPDGFTGLRQLLNTDTDGTRVVNMDPFAATPDQFIDKLDEASVFIGDDGGSASAIFLSMKNKHFLDRQQDQNVRWMNELVDIAVGIRTQAFNSPFGPLPLIPVPGPSIGTYTGSGDVNGETISDIYLVDEATLSLPYLGSPGPTVIEIPTGVGGQLTRMFIVFGMWGLALKAPVFNNKVRVHQS
jgi:hypothetical protein